MRHFIRAIRIVNTLSRHQVDRYLDSSVLPWPTRWAFFFITRLSRRPFSQKIPEAERAAHLRQALEELGPVFIKFGQALSTRRDLLPIDIANELAKLQDHVPPFDSQLAVDIIEKSLGQTLPSAFAEFSSTAIASASIAQVHAATLHTGEKVAVKVLRPNIRSTINTDTQLMQSMASWIENRSKQSRRFKLSSIVRDYRQVIFDELDLQKEAGNTSLLRQHFEHSALLYVPKIFWDYTSHTVMVSEFVNGIPISQTDTLRNEGCDMRQLAENGVEIFFTQVFDNNFFHADMHPGNIFVDCSKPNAPRYIALDCAIMGSLSDSDRYYVARNLLAALERDYDLVARLLIQAEWVPTSTDRFALAATIRSACEPIFNKPLHEISFAGLLIDLFQAAQRFGMEVQPSLVLLQKTMLNIEGLGRELYPELDLWQTALPFLNRWREQRYSLRRLLKTAKQRAPDVIESLPLMLEAAQASIKSGIKPTDAGTSQRIGDTAIEPTPWGGPRLTAIFTIFAASAYLLGTAHGHFANSDPSWAAWPLLGAAILLLWRR